MWKNTSRSTLKQFKKEEKVVNKALSKPPFTGADYILPGGIGAFSEEGPVITEITYYSVLRILSTSLGRIPVHILDKDNNIVQNRAEYLLNVRPNESFSISQLLCYLEFCRNHYGNAYLYVNWSDTTGNIKNLVPLEPRMVRLFIDTDDDISPRFYYIYTTVNGRSYCLDSSDIIHLKSWHLDGQTRMLGIPVAETLRQYMSSAKASQNTQSALYKSGMQFGGILNYSADLNDEQKHELLQKAKNLGTKFKILPLPQGWDLKPINLSLADSQFLEGRRFTAQQIAAAFGVNPNQLNDYSKGSYANATAQTLSFLMETLNFITKCYEDEFSYRILTDSEIKQGLRVDFDTEAILQSTPDVLADILVKYVGGGSILTINEARQKANMPPVPGGDKLFAMPGATQITEEEKVIV